MTNFCRFCHIFSSVHNVAPMLLFGSFTLMSARMHRVLLLGNRRKGGSFILMSARMQQYCAFREIKAKNPRETATCLTKCALTCLPPERFCRNNRTFWQIFSILRSFLTCFPAMWKQGAVRNVGKKRFVERSSLAAADWMGENFAFSQNFARKDSFSCRRPFGVNSQSKFHRGRRAVL